MSNENKIVKNVSDDDLVRTENIRLKQARQIFHARPFVTRIYMSMHYGYPINWLKKNWDYITK